MLCDQVLDTDPDPPLVQGRERIVLIDPVDQIRPRYRILGSEIPREDSQDGRFKIV